MKKLSTFAAAAALAVAAAAPVAADTQNDPFVSTQGGWGLGADGAGAAALAVVGLAVIIAASDDS